MKRQFLKNAETATDIPADLEAYITELQLLYYVPLSYLIADESLLPMESLRFFLLDSNWTQALADGALSIGRVTAADGERDKTELGRALLNAGAALHLPRYSRMHSNHRSKLRNINGTSGTTTGFILRSELVRMLKGLEVSASDGQSELTLLRLDTFSNEIALGLFDGEMKSLSIAEPKTGLTFGLAPGEHILVPKDVTEDKLCKPLRNKSIDISLYKNEAGRLDASGLAAKLGENLGTDIGAAKLAFELIAVANRTIFDKD
jgi:hypothetical protein